MLIFFYNISAADAVVSEPEDIRGTTEGNSASADSSTTEQVSEILAEKGSELPQKHGALKSFVQKKNV